MHPFHQRKTSKSFGMNQSSNFRYRGLVLFASVGQACRLRCKPVIHFLDENLFIELHKTTICITALGLAALLLKPPTA